MIRKVFSALFLLVSIVLAHGSLSHDMCMWP